MRSSTRSGSAPRSRRWPPSIATTSSGSPRELAPDLAGRLKDLAVEVTRDELRQLAPGPLRTGVVAIARRPRVDVAAVVADPRAAPLVVLEDPRDLGNLGAAVRVAAAADAAGVLTTGAHEPWDAGRAARLRGPALRAARRPRRGGGAARDRPLVAVDPGGEVLADDPAARDAGVRQRAPRPLGDDLLARADARLRIPMRPGVSSLNLATAVAAVLFARR